jgi:hypothetical protein
LLAQATVDQMALPWGREVSREGVWLVRDSIGVQQYVWDMVALAAVTITTLPVFVVL